MKKKIELSLEMWDAICEYRKDGTEGFADFGIMLDWFFCILFFGGERLLKGRNKWEEEIFGKVRTLLRTYRQLNKKPKKTK